MLIEWGSHWHIYSWSDCEFGWGLQPLHRVVLQTPMAIGRPMFSHL